MKVLKRIAAVAATVALTVGMSASCFAAGTWGHYIGFSEGNVWYEASEGSFKENSATGWTANMDAIGWGGVWGYQVFQEGKGKVDIKKGEQYTLKCTLKSTKMDKWVVIKIATKENIAFAKWVKLPKNQAVTVDETFTAKCDANSIYFGLGGDFGDRDDEKDLYTWAEGGKSAISDGDGDMAAKATVITCTDYSLAAPAAANDNQQNNNGGNTTQPATNTTTVATGDFGPYACAVAAIAAAAVIVVFSRKRKEA
ncbi:hypothetical protein [Eubacterium sp.]|uniref:hypothetical protein n=1 Tax=Eubacterium sp. TaxID=142586 RepID=UPI00399AC129